MQPPVVIAERISKNYVLGSGIDTTGTLRDALANGAERAWAGVTRRERRVRGPRETLHASVSYTHLTLPTIYSV